MEVRVGARGWLTAGETSENEVVQMRGAWWVRHSKKLVFVYLASLCLLACALALALAPGECSGPDAGYYLEYARLQRSQTDFWLSGSAFNGNFWAMAYPTALAGLLRVTGDSVCGAVRIQAVLTSLLVLIPWLLTRHLGARVYLVAPALLALSPGMWWMSTSVGYEGLLAMSLGGALTCAWVLRQRPNVSGPTANSLAISAGVLSALAVLTQSKSVVVVPVVLYILFSVSRRYATLGVIGLAAGLVPWMLRNFFVLGTFSPLTNNADFNLWVGNSAENPNGGSYFPVPMPPNGLSFRQGAIEFVLSQPERSLELLFSKASRLLLPVFIYPEAVSPGLGSYLLHAWAGILAIIIAIGLVVFIGARALTGPRQVPDITAPAIAVGLFYASHLPFIAEPRFMTAVLPISCAVAAATWITIMKRLKNWIEWRIAPVIRRDRPTAPTGPVTGIS